VRGAKRWFIPSRSSNVWTRWVTINNFTIFNWKLYLINIQSWCAYTNMFVCIGISCFFFNFAPLFYAAASHLLYARVRARRLSSHMVAALIDHACRFLSCPCPCRLFLCLLSYAIRGLFVVVGAATTTTAAAFNNYNERCAIKSCSACFAAVAQLLFASWNLVFRFS